MKIKYYKKNGFGLLETLIASSILIMVVGSILFLERNAILNNLEVQDGTYAANIAQAGVEFLRADRDTQWLNNYTWDNDFKSASNAVYYKFKDCNPACTLDTTQKFTDTNDNAEKITIKINNADVSFYRIIKVEPVPTNFNTELVNQTNVSSSYKMDNTNNKILTKITVIVRYGKDSNKTVSIPFILTNWKPGANISS